jgi:hypothetical protein
VFKTPLRHNRAKIGAFWAKNGQKHAKNVEKRVKIR